MLSRIQMTPILSFLCLAAFGHALESFAQTPGAYRLVANDEPEAVSAAKFAVGEKGQKLGKNLLLTSIVHAQRQVVSGTNYKLCLKVKLEGTSKRAEAVVYRNLQKQYSLTGWKWGECTKPATAPAVTPTSRSGQASSPPSPGSALAGIIGRTSRLNQ
jgi:Aspartic acid proteinase inhibitor